MLATNLKNFKHCAGHTKHPGGPGLAHELPVFYVCYTVLLFTLEGHLDMKWELFIMNSLVFFSASVKGTRVGLKHILGRNIITYWHHPQGLAQHFVHSRDFMLLNEPMNK